MAGPEELDVGGTAVRFTSGDKVYFPRLGAGGTKRALADYYLAVAGGPLLHALGAAEMAIGDLASAHERLTAAIRLLPKDPVVRVDLGSVLRKQGRFIESRRALEEALAIAPGDPTAIAQLAETDLLLGRSDDAERRLRGSLRPPRAWRPLHPRSASRGSPESGRARRRPR